MTSSLMRGRSVPSGPRTGRSSRSCPDSTKLITVSAVNSFVTLARPNCVGSSTAIGEAIRCRGDYRTGKVHLHNAGEARLAGSGVDVAADLRSHSCSSMLRLTPACSAMRAPCSGAYSGHFAIRLPCLPTA